MNKEFILSNLPNGYAYLAEGEDMPEMSYYVHTYEEIAENKLKDINNWNKYKKNGINEKRHKDTYFIFIKAAPAPVVVNPPPKYQFKQITDINIGDVFVYELTGQPAIISANRHPVLPEYTEYIILGVNYTLMPFGKEPLNKEAMVAYLNTYKYIYITSIAPQIEKTLKLARKLLLDSKKNV